MSRGKIRWYSSIRMKIVSAAILCCFAVVGGLSAYNLVNEQKQLIADLEKMAKITAQRLAKHLAGPMWDLDNDLADFTLEAEMLENYIQAIVVWDSDTKSVFSARERSPDGRLQVSFGAIVGDLIKASSEVYHGEKLIGEVVVFASKNQMKRRVFLTIKSGVITLLTLLITLTIIMTIVVNRVIIGPIKRLDKYATDISHGDLKQDIEVESNDEIGQLTNALNRMRTNLRAAFKRFNMKRKVPDQ